MAAPTVLGLNEFTEQPRRRTFSKDAGWAEVRTWIGPQEKATDKEQEILDLYNPESISTTKGIPCTIEATFPETTGAVGQDEDISSQENSTWELIGVDVTRDLRSHPKFHASQVTIAEMERIEDAIRRGLGAKHVAVGANMDKFRDLRLRGTDSYDTYSWILRRTIATSRKSVLTAAMAGINTVYTYAGIWDEAKKPYSTGADGLVTVSGIKWAHPTIRWYNIVGTKWEDLKVDQWLKRPPQVTKNGKKYQISYEWWGATTWSGTLYEGGTGSP